MAPSPWGRVCGPLLLLLLLSLGAGPALGRGLPKPLEDPEPHLIPGNHPRGPMGTEPQALDFLWEKFRDESPWNSNVPQTPAKEVPREPADSPLGPALHGPKASHRGQREGLPVTDDLQIAQGSSSHGWTGPPDSQEPIEQEAPAPHPGGLPHLTFIPITPRLQLRIATVPPSPGPGEPGGQVEQWPPRDEGLVDKAKIRASEISPLEHQGPPHTLAPHLGTTRRPVLEEQGGGEDFQEAARGPLFTQQDLAVPHVGLVSPAEVASSQEPGSQPDLVLAKSLPPAEELPVELPKKTEGEESWEVSLPSPSPKQASELPDVRGSPRPQPSGPPATETPDGQPKPGGYQSEGAEQCWEGAVFQGSWVPQFLCDLWSLWVPFSSFWQMRVIVPPFWAIRLWYCWKVRQNNDCFCYFRDSSNEWSRSHLPPAGERSIGDPRYPQVPHPWPLGPWLSYKSNREPCGGPAAR